MEVIRTENLVRSYRKGFGKKVSDEVKVLKNINLTVEEHEFVGIMGKSGSGKTTLLKTLGLIDYPTEGIVYFKETDTDKLKVDEIADIRCKEIGFVFQDFYLLDSLTIEENIMLPLILGKRKEKEIMEKVAEYAELLGIEHLMHKKTYEISGGEKQRAAIARALINDPEIIFADEPTGNLDSQSGKIVIDTLEKINKEYGKTIVMVTHDPEVASHCKKILLIKDGNILETLEQDVDREVFYQRIVEKMKII